MPFTPLNHMSDISPLAQYQSLVAKGELKHDAQQVIVMSHLETIFHALVTRQRFRDSHLGKLRRKIKPKPPVKGLYLWGSVGIGKTRLIDLFYDCLPVKKMRLHFHAFMQQIHHALHEHQGEKNPLDAIAKEIAAKTIVICFDEFFVSNITDAMLLGELLKSLFHYGTCLIASSNVKPDDLYKHGLQRERFLPAIALIHQYTTELHLKSQVDYRLHHIRQAGVFYTPLDELAVQNMEQSFKHFSANEPVSTETIQLFSRPIRIVKQAHTTIWFEFKDICGRPRSQKDYLALAKAYDTVLISNIPLISPKQNDLIVSLINLIDVFYDAHVRVVISAAASVNHLYTEGNHLQEFERTKSRLIEMQSETYFYHDYKDV